jgi:plastocyanin
MTKLALILSLLALAAFGLVACGDDDDDDAAATTSETTAEETTADDSTGAPGTESGSTVAILAEADGSLAYRDDEASVEAGEVTVDFDNPASIGHDVVVEDSSGEELIRTDVVSGESTTATGELEPGEYTFYCSVPGHREAGMEGTLTAE